MNARSDAPGSLGEPPVTVSVRLRNEGSKLIAAATFQTPQGDLAIDWIFVRWRRGLYDHARVELPGRPDRGIYRPIFRLPETWWTALVAAVEAAIVESER